MLPNRDRKGAGASLAPATPVWRTHSCVPCSHSCEHPADGNPIVLPGAVTLASVRPSLFRRRFSVLGTLRFLARLHRHRPELRVRILFRVHRNMGLEIDQRSLHLVPLSVNLVSLVRRNVINSWLSSRSSVISFLVHVLEHACERRHHIFEIRRSRWRRRHGATAPAVLPEQDGRNQQQNRPSQHGCPQLTKTMWGRLPTCAPIANRRKWRGLAPRAPDNVLPHPPTPALRKSN